VFIWGFKSFFLTVFKITFRAIMCAAFQDYVFILHDMFNYGSIALFTINCGRNGSGSSAQVLPMWSRPERATNGSSFAALRNTAKPAPTTSGRPVWGVSFVG